MKKRFKGFGRRGMRKHVIPKVIQVSATELPYHDNYFGAVITDPPYYDNVPYSYLSDFFYVWLKRTLGDLYPELFATPHISIFIRMLSIDTADQHFGKCGRLLAYKLPIIFATKFGRC